MRCLEAFRGKAPWGLVFGKGCENDKGDKSEETLAKPLCRERE